MTPARALILSALVVLAPLPALAAEAALSPAAAVRPPTVTVVAAVRGTLAETVVASGTLVPREEILVAPEIDGLRILDLLVEEGARVEKGQVLARLERGPIETSLNQNAAARSRILAGIEQAKAQITEAEATLEWARSSFERAQALIKQRVVSEEVFDRREADMRTATARLSASRQALTAAEADLAVNAAQRNDLLWRSERTDIKAPVAGIVSRRDARVGSLAAGAAQPMFRIIAAGEIELEADVAEMTLARLRSGMTAAVRPVGLDAALTGTVRLVAPEVSRATRLGRVRIAVTQAPGLTIGAFARATIEVARRDGVLVPISTVQYGPTGATVQVVANGVVETRAVTIGLRGDDRVEISSGLKEGDVLVRIAGTFLRNGDRVNAVEAR
jgi:HlyD family secretion protein